MKFNSVNVLLVALVLFGLAAFNFPAPVVQLVASRLPILIAVTMFFIGAMLTPQQVNGVIRRWPTVLGGTAIQYAVMPLICFCVAKIIGATDDTLVGLMIVGCVPGAMASNVLTLTAGGNTSYSVSLTTSATVLSPFIVPLTLGLALTQSSSIEVDMFLIFQNLLLTVLIPVISGHLIRRYIPQSAWTFELISPWIANLAILLIIAFVIAKFADELQTHLAELLMPLLAINAFGYLGGYFGGRLLGIPESMRRALTLEVGMQNAGLGVALASNQFPDNPGASVAPAVYVFLCMLTGTLLAAYWRNFAPLDENVILDENTTLDEKPRADGVDGAGEGDRQ